MQLGDILPAIQRKCASCNSSSIPCTECEQEEEQQVIQTKPSSASSSSGTPARAIAKALSPPDAGAPLNQKLRARFEPIFAADLGHVRVHSSEDARATAAELNARAFTHRNHIWLGPGERSDDVALLAHETTHVLQQNAAPRQISPLNRGGASAGAGAPPLTQARPGISQPGDPEEAEANTVSDAVARGARVSAQNILPGRRMIARQPNAVPAGSSESEATIHAEPAGPITAGTRVEYSFTGPFEVQWRLENDPQTYRLYSLLNRDLPLTLEGPTGGSWSLVGAYPGTHRVIAEWTEASEAEQATLLHECVCEQIVTGSEHTALHGELAAAAGRYPPSAVLEWSTWDIVTWRFPLLGDENYIHDFKRRWVEAYRRAIVAAAETFDLPEVLVAGVAYNEVGGDPMWIDDIAHAIRSFDHSAPALEPLTVTNAPNRTSFGNVSTQIRRAAETLGYDPETLTERQEELIIESLRDPQTNIFIAAAHLAELRDIDFPGVSAASMTEEQIRITATRFNRGPGLSLEEIQADLSYGQAVTRRTQELDEMLHPAPGAVPTIQPKLWLGGVDDAFEQEANAFARQAEHPDEEQESTPPEITAASNLVQRQHDERTQTCSGEIPASFSTPPELQSQGPETVPVRVRIPRPGLTDPASASVEEDSEEVTVQSPVESRHQFLLYAVPVGIVSNTAESAGVCDPSRLPAATDAPSTGSGEAASSTNATVPGNAQSGGGGGRATAIVTGAVGPAGGTVYAPDGAPLEVVAVARGHVITSTFTKYAVGAGSTGVLQSRGSIIIVDAGVHLGPGGVPDLGIEVGMTRLLRQVIGSRTVTEVMFTHAHLDHTAMAGSLASNFEIGSVQMNLLQEMHPSMQRALAEMRAGLQQYRQSVEARVRADLEGTRTEWEARQEIQPDAGQREARWQNHVSQQVRDALARISETRLDRLVQASGGRFGVVSEALARPGSVVASPSGSETAGPGIQRRAFSDPALGETAGQYRPGDRVPSALADRMATSYIVQLRGGARFLVLPDLRAADYERIVQTFRNEVRAIGSEATIQVWDISHHMQSGWAEPRPTDAAARRASHSSNWTQQTVRATQLAEISRFLHEFRAAPRPGSASADVVVVSAQHDANAQGRSYVDPAKVWMLRSLGFEVFLAHSGRDVQVLDVLTSQGRRISGVRGEAFGAARPSEALLAMSEAGLADLRSRVRLARQELRRTRPGDPRHAQLQSEIGQLEADTRQLDTLRRSYIDGFEGELGRSRSGSSRPAEAPSPGSPEPAQAQAQALRDALIRLNYHRPATTGTDARFTNEALVILRQQTTDATAAPDSAAGFSHRLAQARDRVSSLRDEMATSEAPHEVRVRLAEALTSYRELLDQYLQRTDIPDASRVLFEDERSTARRQFEEITRPEGTRPTIQRVVGSGELVESRVVATRRADGQAEQSGAQGQPSGRGQAVGRAISEGSGRVFGGLMIIQTVRGQAEQIQRYEDGRATLPQTAVGTAHNALGISVGLRMVRGIHVNPAEFVVLSALDITQTALVTYENETQRNIEVTYSAIRNGVNLALMVAGGALMRTNHPIAVLAGLGIMMAGDKALEVLGVHDALERAFEFLPAEVTNVNQDLRRLIEEYSVILGAQELVARGDEGLRQVGAADPGAVRSAANKAVSEHRSEAREKERDILSEFRSAYERARTGYAGLRELDQLRARFLHLQHLATQGEETPFNRALIESTFRSIEGSISMDSMSAQQIRELEQWSSMDDKLDDLADELDESTESDIDWDDVQEAEDEISAMIHNARYRLSPADFGGPRSSPLLAQGSAAREVYEGELVRRERRLSQIRSTLATFAAGGAPPQPGSVEERQATMLGYPTSAQLAAGGLDCAPTLERFDQALRSYKVQLAVDVHLPAGITPAGLATDPEMASRYLIVLEENDDLQRALWRLQATESALIGLASQATLSCRGTEVSPEHRERLARLLNEKDAAIEDRREVRSILFKGEARSRQAQTQRISDRSLALRLGQSPDVQILSDAEMAALESDEMSGIGGVSTEENQIARARRQGARRLYLLVGEFNPLGNSPRNVTSADNIVVANIGQPADQISGTGHFTSYRVIPVNRAAITLFGTRPDARIPDYQLIPLDEQTLAPPGSSSAHQP